MKAVPESKTLFPVGKKAGTGSITSQIEGRQTQELILGFCGALGGGISTVAKAIMDKVEDYGYTSHYIRVSDFIADYVPSSAVPIDERLSSEEAKRIDALQGGGNFLRKKYGNEILASLCVKAIAVHRVTKVQDSGETGGLKRESVRLVHIIDSLKHPDEVNLLRAVYGNMFYLFTILCANPKRKSRLERMKQIPSAESELLMVRDEAEDDYEYGQKLRDTVQYGDFFVRNNHDNAQKLEPAIDKYVKLILGDLKITPNKHEYAMYLAQSAALRSGCISRQVGACIVDDRGEVISTGCNDVPKYPGGLYSADDGAEDARCMNRDHGRCWNAEFKSRIKSSIKGILAENLSDKPKIDELTDKISNNKFLKGLLEYSRSVHAEMAAILDVALNGKRSLKGCSLYCTTFPCHICARHIVAAGLSHVFYIEPYEKSLALTLHDDSIALESETGEGKKVIFSHFEGVGPRKFMDLFQDTVEKKKDGKLVKRDLRQASPVIPQLMDTYQDYESKVISYLEEKGLIEKEKGSQNGKENQK